MKKRMICILLVSVLAASGCGQKDKSYALKDKTVIGDDIGEYVDAALNEEIEKDEEESKAAGEKNAEKDKETEKEKDKQDDNEYPDIENEKDGYWDDENIEDGDYSDEGNEDEEYSEELDNDTLSYYKGYCKSRYKEIIEDTVTDTGFGGYYLCDINNDGLEDLIVGWGECEADYTNTVYMLMEYDEDYMNVDEIGTFAGDSVLFEAADGNGIDAVTSRMGTLRVRRITLNDNENGLNEETILETSDSGQSGYSNNKELKFSECTDMTLLEKMC